MIQAGTNLKIVDNSGAKKAKCIKVLGSSRRRYAQLGDVVTVAVKEASPNKLVSKHDVVRAVIVRQRRAYRRDDGSYVRFEDNAAVILEGKTEKPRGSRIFGPVAREVKKFEEVIGLAKELV